MRQVLRGLGRQWAFAWMTIGMLAVGIAANTTIFSIYNGLFLRPLPGVESERLVDLNEEAPKWNLAQVQIAYVDFEQWRARNHTFEGMAVWATHTFNLAVQGVEARSVDGARVSHDFAKVLGLKPALGRGFLAEEDRPGGAKVAMLGHRLWENDFGSDASVVGTGIRLDGERFTIVGVLPEEAQIPEADLWVPLAERPGVPGNWYLQGVGRLKAGVTPEEARRDLLAIHRSMAESRDANEITSPLVRPLRERFFGGDTQKMVALVQGAVALVLLIACWNAAALVLARGMTRRHEIGIRQAMGATRGRIVRTLFAESLILAVAAGAIGMLGGLWLMDLLPRIMPSNVPAWVRYEVDWRHLVFSVALCAAAAAVFGLIPALRASEVNVGGALRDTSARASGGKRRTWNLLVAGEVAMALVLVVATGLLVEGMQRLRAVDPGFDARNVLTFRVSLRGSKYLERGQREAFFRELLEKLRQAPGVQSAGATMLAPFDGHNGTTVEIEGIPRDPKGNNPVVVQRTITPEYLRAMGVRLEKGRPFDWRDGSSDGTATILVDETFVRTFLRDREAIGSRVSLVGQKRPWMTVVGVVGDVMQYGLQYGNSVSTPPGIYIPYPFFLEESMTLVLRTRVEPMSVVPAVRAVLGEMDASIPLANVRTMSDRVDASLAGLRVVMVMFTVFAAVALSLAAGGVYGVVSYAVSRRAREIGIRKALGARNAAVLWLILRESLVAAAAGVLAGIVVTMPLAAALAGMVSAVRPVDAPLFAGVAAAMFVMVAAATLIPARRLAYVEAADSLREE